MAMSGRAICRFLPRSLLRHSQSFQLHRIATYAGAAVSHHPVTPPSSAPQHYGAEKLVRQPARITGHLKDIEVKVTNFQREDRGLATLAGDVFHVPIRPDIVHRVVRWQLAKRRQGTHSTRGIHEVSGTGKKPGPQKGSGRARHGSLRGPQFRGGATQHGPKPRSHEIGLQKQVRRLGLKVALSSRIAEGKLKVFDTVEAPTCKTREMERLIAGMEDCKKVLFVDDSEKVNESLCRATGNLHYVNVIPAKGLNVYSILQHDTLVMSLGAVRKIEERLHTPINR